MRQRLTGGTGRRGGRLAAEGAGPNEVAVQVYLREGRLKDICRLRELRKRYKGPLTRAGEKP